MEESLRILATPRTSTVEAVCALTPASFTSTKPSTSSSPDPPPFETGLSIFLAAVGLDGAPPGPDSSAALGLLAAGLGLTAATFGLLPTTLGLADATLGLPGATAGLSGATAGLPLPAWGLVGATLGLVPPGEGLRPDNEERVWLAASGDLAGDVAFGPGLQKWGGGESDQDYGKRHGRGMREMWGQCCTILPSALEAFPGCEAWTKEKYKCEVKWPERKKATRSSAARPPLPKTDG